MGYRDCLACGRSLSEIGIDDDDRLFCLLKKVYVEEDDCCEDFNSCAIQ